MLSATGKASFGTDHQDLDHHEIAAYHVEAIAEGWNVGRLIAGDQDFDEPDHEPADHGARQRTHAAKYGGRKCAKRDVSRRRLQAIARQAPEKRHGDKPKDSRDGPSQRIDPHDVNAERRSHFWV